MKFYKDSQRILVVFGGGGGGGAGVFTNSTHYLTYLNFRKSVRSKEGLFTFFFYFFFQKSIELVFRVSFDCARTFSN